MNPNEFRLGNCISFKGLWIGQIERISDSGVLDIRGNKGIFEIEDFEPVVVTRELLYKIGAEDFPDGESLCLHDRLIGFAECRNEFYDKSTSVTLKYLHQLQNLVFATSGKEIDIDITED